MVANRRPPFRPLRNLWPAKVIGKRAEWRSTVGNHDRRVLHMRSDPLPLSPRKQQIRHLADASAPQRREWLARAAFFHAEDLLYLKFLIGKGTRVLELGCGTGDLLAELHPSY